MTALRSALAMLNRRRQEINNKAFRHAHSAAPLHPSAIRNRNVVEDYRHFSTDVREPTGKAVSGMRIWWHRATSPIQRIKHRIATADLQERTMALYVYLIFGLGTSTVFWVKTARDIYYRV